MRNKRNGGQSPILKIWRAKARRKNPNFSTGQARIAAPRWRDTTGQSLLELLLAIAVGVILIGAMVVVIAPTLKINTETNEAKIGAALGRELVEDLRVVAEKDWHNIDTLATGTSNIFYVTSTNTLLVATSGLQNITIGTTTYTRYFYIEDVCRDNSGNMTTTTPSIFGCANDGLKDDPSTKKATVVFRWPQSATNTFSTLFTRWRSRVFGQTDWSSGVTSSIISATSSATGFVTSSNISYASTTGEIYITSVVADE